MGRKASPTVIGAFVLGALALVVVAVMIWGSGRLFQRTQKFICYFPGSVNGLSPGAPVKFRGVQIGEVTDIRILHHRRLPVPRIPVYLTLDSERMRGLGLEREATPEVVRELIDSGLRARLQTLSIVTGVLFVDFDLLPGSPLQVFQEPDERPTEIPTLPTPLEEATKTVSDILAQLKEVDFKGIGKSVREAVDGVNHLTNNPRLAAAIDGLPDAVADARRLLANLDRRTGPLTDSLHGASEDARQALATLRATLDGIQALLGPEAPLSVEAMRAIVDLGRAGRAIGDLADYLERNPNAVVFGRARP